MNSSKIKKLFDRISNGSAAEAETLRELRELVFEAPAGPVKERLGRAVETAEIYFSPRRCARLGGREALRDQLLEHLYVAEHP